MINLEVKTLCKHTILYHAYFVFNKKAKKDIIKVILEKSFINLFCFAKNYLIPFALFIQYYFSHIIFYFN